MKEGKRRCGWWAGGGTATGQTGEGWVAGLRLMGGEARPSQRKCAARMTFKVQKAWVFAR